MVHPGSYSLDAMVCTVTVTHLAWLEWHFKLEFLPCVPEA